MSSSSNQAKARYKLDGNRYPIRRIEGTQAIFVRCTVEQKARWKAACAAMNMSYMQWVEFQLDRMDADLERGKRFQKSPLHQVGNEAGRGYADEDA